MWNVRAFIHIHTQFPSYTHVYSTISASDDSGQRIGRGLCVVCGVCARVNPLLNLPPVHLARHIGALGPDTKSRNWFQLKAHYAPERRPRATRSLCVCVCLSSHGLRPKLCWARDTAGEFIIYNMY